MSTRTRTRPVSKAPSSSAASASGSPAPQTSDAEVDAIAGLSDQEVLARAANYGPGIIGAALYERAKEIRDRTAGGRFGPAIVGSATGTGSVVSPDAFEPWKRNELLKLARQRGVPAPPSATKDQLIELLVARNIPAVRVEG